MDHQALPGEVMKTEGISHMGSRKLCSVPLGNMSCETGESSLPWKTLR
jgi:hypothetical protein